MSLKTVLGIETSCDDTSIAILRGDFEKLDQQPEILAFESFTQETLLAEWGGVVPEIASRNHLDKIVPLLKSVIKKAGVELPEIDLIGVTTFPGLLGPLLTGLNAAKTVSMVHKTSVVPVNHLFAHLEAIHLTEHVEYPYLGLLVSGGHSLYAIVHDATNMEILGSTIDDAAGEAFDKGGKLAGLGYPAGRIIDDLSKKGDPKKYEFPIGMRGSADCNLSYSGVKTSLRQFLEKNPEHLVKEDTILEQKHFDMCASYQHAIVSALKLKMKYALKATREKMGRDLPIVVGGGVACNSYLRETLTKSFKNVSFVSPKYCTDNGAMIANYALRTSATSVAYPESLTLDARSRFIKKGRR